MLFRSKRLLIYWAICNFYARQEVGMEVAYMNYIYQDYFRGELMKKAQVVFTKVPKIGDVKTRLVSRSAIGWTSRWGMA
mgnify:CR=1 FL=1